MKTGSSYIKVSSNRQKEVGYEEQHLPMMSLRKPCLLTHQDWHNHLLTLLPREKHTSTKVVVMLSNDNAAARDVPT